MLRECKGSEIVERINKYLTIVRKVTIIKTY